MVERNLTRNLGPDRHRLPAFVSTALPESGMRARGEQAEAFVVEWRRYWVPGRQSTGMEARAVFWQATIVLYYGRVLALLVHFAPPLQLLCIGHCQG